MDIEIERVVEEMEMEEWIDKAERTEEPGDGPLGGPMRIKGPWSK